MSSDSEDLDEDELLQMALKEQSQRDLSYQKAPKKPVVNLVQRPQPPASKNSVGGKPSKKSQQSRVDDDDDSEVELLSISSGDEEMPMDRGASRGSRAAAGDAKKRGGADDDQGWDGEEPARWKHVDETELARRVREMRETRSAPVAPSMDRKVSIGKKGLTNLQSLPRGMEALDPLGLGIIDSRTLLLITEKSESSPTTMGDKSNKTTLDPSERDRINYYSEKFDPKLFLSRVHKHTPAADLESAALSLKSDLIGRTQQKKKLVKENFDCFVSCKTTIDDIESKLKQIEEDPEGAGTARLFEATQKITSLANLAFQPLFERQVQAEKIRSVQGMLQRFRTLFNLPSTIRGNIRKGEYDLAVREYRKAKSIVLPSHVGILKRVLEEVEKVMQEFRSMLYKSMEDPQLELAELENTVRLLLDLEPDSDPVWHYLHIQNRRLLAVLENCTADHETRMEILQNEIREKELSDAKWRQLLRDSSKSFDADPQTEETQFSVEQPFVDSVAADALRARYIRRLTTALLLHLPQFWRVALSVFSGKFAKVSTGNVIVDSETNAKPTSNRQDDKAGDMKYSSHSLDEVSIIAQGTISYYEDKILNTFQDFEESNVLRSYMIDSVKEIVKACQDLEGKESAPASAVKSLRVIQFEMSKIYILRLCSWMRAEAESLSETWIPLSTLERNRSPYTISCMPLEFQAVTTSAMDQISERIQNLKNDMARSSGLAAQVQDIQESVRIAFLKCFMDFAGHLDRIGGELSQNRLSRTNSYLQQEELLEPRGASAIHPGASAFEIHKKILIILSNIGYCKDELSEELYKKYMHIWLQPREKDEEYSDVRDLAMSFSASEERILEQYTVAKANLIREAAVKYLLDAGIQWGAAPAVKGVRDATTELMNTLVSVHAEVSYGAKPLLEKILRTLVEGLIDTLIGLFNEYRQKELKTLDANGFCQITLELEYFENVLSTYFSMEARDSLKSLHGLLLEKATESITEPAENPGHNRRATRGSEDAMMDDRQQTSSVSPDDLLAFAQQCSGDFLDLELERTRLNILCFRDSSARPTPAPAAAPPPATKPAYSRGPAYLSSFRGGTQQSVASPVASRYRRR